MSPDTSSPLRSRVAHAVAALLVVGIGLVWRSGLVPLPSVAVKYGGVALWALMVFLGVGAAVPRAATARVAAMAVGIAWCVEFLQLYHAPWIDAVRSTRLGRLVLGATFNTPDLLAYCAGVAGGAVADHACRRRSRS